MDNKEQPLAATHPELAKEWDYEHNADLTPRDVTAGSGRVVHWVLEYDDPDTGHQSFRWQAAIYNRTIGKQGCPYLAGRVWPGFNDLATTHPELVKEWDYERNADLTPQDVTAGSNRVVYWTLEYDDPGTGHQSFRWQAAIYNRAIGKQGCPYLTGRVWPGFNDLATTHPELAKEWDYERNADLTPRDVTAGSNRVVYWTLEYDDPDMGHQTFRWDADIYSRAIRNQGCPYLHGKRVLVGYNDLLTRFPSVAADWDYERNLDLTPDKVTYGSRKVVHWCREVNDPVAGHHILRWKDRICHRTMDHTGCPYLSGRAIWPGFNDLATTHPELVKEWDYERNTDLTPQDVTAGSSQIIHWIMEYDDPIVGHRTLRWQDTVNGRALRHRGCPYITGLCLLPGFNDLETRCPDIAAEWDYTANGSLLPSQVRWNSVKVVGWHQLCEHPYTHTLVDIQWSASVYKRTRLGRGNPYLNAAKLLPGFNDLQSCRPDVAIYWHPTRNGTLRPCDVHYIATKEVWWLYPYDDPRTGQHHDFEWSASIRSVMKADGQVRCPYLGGYAIWPGFNDLESQYPAVAQELHPTKNRGVKASEIFMSTTTPYWWLCPHCKYEWIASPRKRTLGNQRCPHCHQRHSLSV